MAPLGIFGIVLAYGFQRFLNQNLRSFKWEYNPSFSCGRNELAVACEGLEVFDSGEELSLVNS